ncbi:60S ribosomal protein L13a [Atta colombica]|uniref:Decapping nuclease n=1 Tax=Atta colombica TaxID=520822 RepID=A0A195BQG1_9HYME|nr:60S ribosomal protein L13a [Atta colombica]
MSFQIDFINFSEQIISTLTTELIGHFSIDNDLQYHADLSQLKYYIPPSDPNNVNFDLNKNFMSTRHRPTSYLKLDNLLRWLSNNFHRFEKPLSVLQKEHWLDIEFIASRGTIKTILYSLYKMRDEWIICASKYRGTIYLCEFYSNEREHQYINASMSEKQLQSWGYKFDQYMIAGMIPHKTQRGKDALRRLKVYEGCPPPYDRRKRVVVPGAMRVMCLKPGRKYCHVGRLSHEVGWKYKDVVRTLENKRRARAILEVQKRNKLKKLTKQAGESVAKATAPYTAIINNFGYN